MYTYQSALYPAGAEQTLALRLQTNTRALPESSVCLSREIEREKKNAYKNTSGMQTFKLA